MRLWLIRHRLRVLVHRIRFPGVPMFSVSAMNELLAKHVIVGLTRETHDGELIRHEQVHGRIVRGTRQEGIVIQVSDGGEMKLPPDLRPFFGARRGEYRFKSSGAIVRDPDLLTAWTIRQSRQTIE